MSVSEPPRPFHSPSKEDFLLAFPEGSIVWINAATLRCPPEIELIPCTELGDRDHTGALVPGTFRLVTIRPIVKEESADETVETSNDPTGGV